jgi:hypothetical protein
MVNLPDYRLWNAAHLRDEDRKEYFQKEVVPWFLHPDAVSMMPMLDEYSWLREFISPEHESPITNALAEYRRMPNETTICLTDFVKLFTATLIIQTVVRTRFETGFSALPM